MKKEMKNPQIINKGFTLVELIAVIVIIAVISVLSFASITKTIKNSQIKEIEVFETNLENATQIYVETNITDFPQLNTIGGSVEITTTTLILKGYLDEDIYNPSDCDLANSTVSVVKQADNTIEYTVSCTVKENPGEYASYANGTVVYFNPVTGSTCLAGEAISTTGTKTGCMKWYTFNDGGSTSSSINIILDHNTTALVAWSSTGTNTGGMKEVATALTSDTSTWTAGLGQRLITANEVATIVEIDGWTTNSVKIGYYFASKTYTQLATCTSPNFTECTYKWLYDRTATNSATKYGSLNNSDSTTYGYWTSSAHDIDSNNSWNVNSNGSLNDSPVSYSTIGGVRPVITILKSVLSNIVADTTAPVITGATDITIGPDATTFNVMEGVSSTDNSGETIIINTISNLTLGVVGTYTVTYIAIDSSGNTTSVTRIINIAYINGTVVYFNPVTGLKCNLAAYTANTGASNNGTKTGCMKWYTFNDVGSTSLSVNVILDHNTTAMVAWNSTGSNVGGMKEVAAALTSDTSTWKSGLSQRLITANEVAMITEKAGWTTTSFWYYFASNQSLKSETCTSPILTGCTHKWLYDRTSTDSATIYGSLNNADSTTYGYWTSSAHGSDSTKAWFVYNAGYMKDVNTNYSIFGVRPVITILKSNL